MNQSHQPRKKALFLYFELAGYFISSLRQLTTSYDVDAHVVNYPVNAVAPFQFEKPDNIYFYERASFNRESLIKWIEELKPSFIFCCGWIDKDYVAACKYFSGSITTVLSLDNPWQGKIKQHIAGIIGKIYLSRIFHYAWVPGQPQVNYCKQLGFAKNAIFTGLYAADLQWFNQQYELNKAAKEKSFPKKLLFAGRYTEHKGVKEMWNAFVRLHNETPNEWELWCLGKGELEHLLPKHDKIKNFGFVQPAQLGSFISQCGVFILASRLEHWGVVLHEFAAAGMPIISSDKTSAASSFLVDKKNGWLQKAGDEESMLQCFKQMIAASNSELNVMATNSHQLAQSISPKQWAATAWMLLNKKDG